jgi:hypothetical protein
VSSEYSYDKELGKYQLNCCDWTSVTEIQDTPLLVTVSHKVYAINDKDLTFEGFYTFTQARMYSPALLAGEKVGVSLPCPRCGGDGKTDWVEKVMKKQKNTIPMPHKRDPHGRVLKFRVPLSKNPHIPQTEKHDHPFFKLDFLITYLEKGITHQFVYTSLPHLNKAEELCPSCYGSGLRIVSDKETELVVSER